LRWVQPGTAETRRSIARRRFVIVLFPSVVHMPKAHPDSLLSSSVSVSQYIEMEKNACSNEIAKFAFQRFSERYIGPFSNNTNKNGFIMMASACLLIEALESFWNGWRKSPNSSLAFSQFFDRNEGFSDFHGHSKDFYTHVRCGIMHQGETTGGWHIRRDLGQLFFAPSRTIDATKFLGEMENSLSNYCKSLQHSPWDHPQWKNFRKKMDAICKNTMR
jgi:hypothetical protein